MSWGVYSKMENFSEGHHTATLGNMVKAGLNEVQKQAEKHFGISSAVPHSTGFMPMHQTGFMPIQQTSGIRRPPPTLLNQANHLIGNERYRTLGRLDNAPPLFSSRSYRHQLSDEDF
jgi:hypothetical protein